jgi:hypothetical protein
MNSLALAMIVRDEAEQLPAFLAHHAGLADEVIVVDTGSSDGTLGILHAAGAKVIEHSWQDDFAAARNAGLAAAAADWILILDADERLSQRDFGQLRETLGGAGPGVFLQETWNYCAEGTHLEWQPPPGRYPAEEAGQEGLFIARRAGLFPRREGLIFSGRVHESVLPAAEGLGLAVWSLDLPVHHYGHVRGEAVSTARRRRYRHLAALKHLENPHDPAACLELAAVKLEDGDTASALALLADVAGGPRGLRPVVRALVLQGRLQRELGALDAARILLDEACRQDPDFVFGWLEWIRVEAAAESWSAAETVLTNAESRFGPAHPQLLRESVRVKIKNRQLPAALAAADELVRICPQWRAMQDLAVRLRKMLHSSGAD